MDIRWQFCYPIKLISKSFYPNLMLEAIILIWVYSILQIKKQIDWNRKYILVKKKTGFVSYHILDILVSLKINLNSSTICPENKDTK